MYAEVLRALVTDSERFTQTALDLQWADTQVTHLELAEGNIHWVFLRRDMSRRILRKLPCRRISRIFAARRNLQQIIMHT